MDTTLEKLVIQIQADTRELKKGLDKVKKNLDQTEKKSKKASSSLKKLRGVLGTIGGAAILNQIVQTNRTFEDLEATLRAVTGSALAAEKSFELIRAFTSTTTFQIEEVAQAFITLKQAGIVPTSEVLQDFGNFAAGMGKSITQLAQAAFNATTGEMEMLKQFGVIARQQGDTITVTFDGTTKTIERSGAAITEFLRSIGREKFPTAIEERFNTLSGAISNLKDQISEFNVSVGDGVGGLGLRQSFIDLAKATASLIETLRPLGQVIGFLIGAITNVVTIIIKTIDAVLILITALTKLTTPSLKLKDIFNENVKSFDDFAKAVRGGADDVLGLDTDLLSLIKTGADFKTLFTASEMTDFKLFEQLKKQVQSSRRTVQDLIDNEMKALRDIINKTIDLQLKIEIAQAIDADPNSIGRTITRAGDQFFVINDAEVEKRREQIVRALLGVGTVDEFLAEVNEIFQTDAINKELEYIGAEIRDTATFSDELQQTITDAANAFTQDFVNSLMQGQNALESFRDFAGNIVNQIITIFLQLEVVNRILAAIFPGFQGQVGTGLFRDPNFVGPPQPNIFQRRNASGGTMQKGMPSIVGERGAELFIPHSGGTLLNNMNTKKAIGGATTVINQNINFATGVVPTVRAEVTKMLPQIADITKGAVQEAAMRGGSYRRSLLGG